jgi:hypothetical protein
MSADAMDRILQLVAEGRLTAAEAGPILDALAGAMSSDESQRHQTPRGSASAAGSKASSDGSPARAIRIEVSESGRQVVNLRVPLALGREALARIPGLSESLTDRVREAMASGFKGSIVDVDDEGGGVRIYIE